MDIILMALFINCKIKSNKEKTKNSHMIIFKNLTIKNMK
jgi:hypothetical protein